MIAMLCLLIRSLCAVCFHTSILVTKLSDILPAVFFGRCLLLGTVYTALSNPHFKQVMEGCLVYDSNKQRPNSCLPKVVHCLQGASPMASRLSSQHASHSSTPAHTFSSMGPAAATTSLSKPEQQASQQNGGVQVLQVQNHVMCVCCYLLLLLDVNSLV